MAHQVVAIGGSVRPASRTASLVGLLANAVAARIPADVRRIEMATAGPALLAGLTRDALGPDGLGIVAAVEAADLLIVGTPVYRTSYTGVLKHLFDLLDNRFMAGKVALLAATGGSPLHGLVTEYTMRPLLSYFGAVIVPTAVYAVEADFAGPELANPGVAARVQRAAEEAVRLLQAGPVNRAIPMANIA
jgi:FMN reductase